jgi:hypothetical protein
MNFDDLKNKAEGLLHEHKDQVADGVEKASELAKDKLGHAEQIDKAADFAQDKLKNL